MPYLILETENRQQEQKEQTVTNKMWKGANTLRKF